MTIRRRQFLDGSGDDDEPKRIYDPLPTYPIPKLSAIVCSSASNVGTSAASNPPIRPLAQHRPWSPISHRPLLSRRSRSPLPRPASHEKSPQPASSIAAIFLLFAQNPPAPPPLRHRRLFILTLLFPRLAQTLPRNLAHHRRPVTLSQQPLPCQPSLPPLQPCRHCSPPRPPYPSHLHSSLSADLHQSLWRLRYRAHNTAALLANAQMDIATRAGRNPAMGNWLDKVRAQLQ
ncbi:hypothetical protein niasHT_010250 [Heterodera trifolii]|uniref:Uncharacterized protein n=1 Tax=Heterodera trifolii TaxID=157864 RepID=A0ABD2LR26_9BILA